MSKSAKPAVLVGVPVPPPDSRPYVPGITLPANREVDFLCVHSQVVGFMMHWFEEQSFPCPVDRAWCAGCKAGATPRWTGFIGVVSCQSANRFIARIPTAAFRESGVFKDKSDAKMLAGCVFTSWRFGPRPTKTRPVVIEMKENNNSYPRVKPFDLLSALARWWRVDSLQGFLPVACPANDEMQKAISFIELQQKLKASRQKGKGEQEP